MGAMELTRHEFFNIQIESRRVSFTLDIEQYYNSVAMRFQIKSLLYICLTTLLPLSVRGQLCGDDLAPPAVIHGNKFFSSYSGEYIAIKGLSYYPRPNEGELTLTNSIDFFTEEYRHIWERDIEHFKELGVNAIRIYAVDPGKNHDAFMCALKASGIYVIVGLAADCFNCAITFAAPPDCYSPELRRRGEFIISEFAKYENVLAFSAGNEISLFPEENLHSTDNAPCQKKFLRDMRAFIRRCSGSMREIPVG